MKYTQLGRRGPIVSTMGFGSWAIGGMDWGATDDEVSKRALHEALDLGVTLVDTADVYGRGHSERLVAEVLDERGGKGDVIIATKAGSDFYNATPKDDSDFRPVKANTDRDYIMFACEQSLRRLGVDCLDILQLHSPTTDLLDRDDPWEALATLKQQGKIRWAGWSIQSFKETEQSFLLERHGDLIDVVQVRYNLLEREAEKVLFPMTQRLGTGVIVRIPILFGLLAGKFHKETKFGPDDHRRLSLSPEKLASYLDRLDGLNPLYFKYPDQTKAQIGLRFCITHPACHAAIPGGKTFSQVRDNCAASDMGPLAPGDVPEA